MPISGILENHVLLTALIGWGLAQILKVPVEYIRFRKLNWALLLSAGGMPSSHSALVVSTTIAIGLHLGFDTDLFALGVATTMVVLYDAAGVRREAGIHAQKINILINELLAGHPISDKQLREVLGHTPWEVTGGTILGIATAIGYWYWIGYN